MDLVGEILDERYRLEEVVGAGAMGSVYRAVQLTVGRRVAVKLLHPFLQSCPKFRSRFGVEARAIARLNHPNCITLYDFGYCEHLRAYYMVTEYAEGIGLDEVLAERELDPALTCLVVQQIAHALQHAHDKGILHRDLKPENVALCASDGQLQVKVLDFGLARLLFDTLHGAPQKARVRRITDEGQTNGTPSYMSPEQCRGEQTMGPPTDVYSLGVMLYEMLEGRRPFEGRNAMQVMLEHLSGEVPAMSERAPQPLRELVYQMLRKDPAERPQRVDIVAQALQPYIEPDRRFGDLVPAPRPAVEPDPAAIALPAGAPTVPWSPAAPSPPGETRPFVERARQILPAGDLRVVAAMALLCAIGLGGLFMRSASPPEKLHAAPDAQASRAADEKSTGALAAVHVESGEDGGEEATGSGDPAQKSVEDSAQSGPSSQPQRKKTYPRPRTLKLRY